MPLSKTIQWRHQLQVSFTSERVYEEIAALMLQNSMPSSIRSEDNSAHTMISMKLINPCTVEQTNVRDGNVVFVARVGVTPYGDTIYASSESKEDESVKTCELHKQPK
jgi:hypothetical protein